jgi:hypothetical protein
MGASGAVAGVSPMPELGRGCVKTSFPTRAEKSIAVRFSVF